MTTIRSTPIATYLMRLGETRDTAGLVEVLVEYQDSIATPDMIQQALDMDRESYLEFREGLYRECNGGENTDEWLDKYGGLMVPPAFSRLLQMMELIQDAPQDQG